MIYDQAHQLARTLASSSEYQAFVEAKQKVSANEKTLEMLRSFRRRQMEVQTKKILGQEVSTEQEGELERMSEILGYNETIREFLAAEAHLARVIGDIQKILADAIPEWFEFAKLLGTEGEKDGEGN